MAATTRTTAVDGYTRTTRAPPTALSITNPARRPAPGCTRHARTCPQRHGGGLKEVDVKPRAGRRAVGISRAARGSPETTQGRSGERTSSGSTTLRGRRSGISPAERAAHRPSRRSRRWEGASASSRRPRRSTARRAPHRRHHAARPRRADAGRDGSDGLAADGHDNPLSAPRPELVGGIAEQVAGLLWRTN